jgi:hypothetical protein
MAVVLDKNLEFRVRALAGKHGCRVRSVGDKRFNLTTLLDALILEDATLKEIGRFLNWNKAAA